MSEQQGTQQGAAGQAHERCVCNEVFHHIQDALGVSPTVRQHLANSRIEILKAIRSVIDEKIERLSKPIERGAKIAVE
jgi:predicted metalloprotease